MDNDPTTDPTAQEIVTEYLEAQKTRRVRARDLTPRQQAGLFLSLSTRVLAGESIRIDESLSYLDLLDKHVPWCDVLSAVVANIIATRMNVEVGETSKD